MQASKEVTISVTQVGDANDDRPADQPDAPVRVRSESQTTRETSPGCGTEAERRTATPITEPGRYKNENFEEKRRGADHATSMFVLVLLQEVPKRAEIRCVNRRVSVRCS